MSLMPPASAELRLPRSRRSALRGGAAVLGWSLLCSITTAGCGFALRQPPTLAFQTIYLSLTPATPFTKELRHELATLGSLQVLTDPAQRAGAQAVLDVLAEQREKIVVGRNASGQVRAFQLRLRVRFWLHTEQGQDLIAPTELLQQRDISFNESAVLAKEAEEALLYRDMQSDIVHQLLRRIAAVKPV